MNLKENSQYIFNKNAEQKNKKTSNILTQKDCLKSSQTEACSILFQISNSETLQPLVKKMKDIQKKTEITYSPWRQYTNICVLNEQQRKSKNYLSTNKNVLQKSFYKKQKRELSMKVLSQLIQFPLKDEPIVYKQNKRCSYFQKCKTKEQNEKDTSSQNKVKNFNSELGVKVSNIQSQSVQVLHIKKQKDSIASKDKQRSVLILPNYNFFDNKPNLARDKIKMNLLKRRLNKRSNKASQRKQTKKQQNIDLILGNLLRQKLKNGMLNLRDFPKDCKTCKTKNQNLCQKINSYTKTQGIYKIK